MLVLLMPMEGESYTCKIQGGEEDWVDEHNARIVTSDLSWERKLELIIEDPSVFQKLDKLCACLSSYPLLSQGNLET